MTLTYLTYLSYTLTTSPRAPPLANLQLSVPSYPLNGASAENKTPPLNLQPCLRRPPAYFLRCDKSLSGAASGRRTCGPTTRFTLGRGQDERGLGWDCGVYSSRAYNARRIDGMRCFDGSPPEAWFRYCSREMLLLAWRL